MALAPGSYVCGGAITTYGVGGQKLYKWESRQNYHVTGDGGHIILDAEVGTSTIYYIGWRYDHQSYNGRQGVLLTSTSFNSIGYFSFGSLGGIGTSYERARIGYYIDTTGCAVGGDILPGW